MSNAAIETDALACTLTDEEYKKRRTQMRQKLLPHVVRSSLEAFELTLEFTENKAIRNSVEGFVALERQCCSFLTFNVSPPGQGLLLVITGPEGSQSTLEQIYGEANTSEY